MAAATSMPVICFDAGTLADIWDDSIAPGSECAVDMLSLARNLRHFSADLAACKLKDGDETRLQLCKLLDFHRTWVTTIVDHWKMLAVPT